MEISDRVAVLRKGKYIGDVPTSETNAMKLTEMMVGRAVSLDIERSEPVNPQPRLIVKNLNVCDKDGVYRLCDVNFTAYSGEIRASPVFPAADRRSWRRKRSRACRTAAIGRTLFADALRGFGALAGVGDLVQGAAAECQAQGGCASDGKHLQPVQRPDQQCA